jgi:hypothetical protein
MVVTPFFIGPFHRFFRDFSYFRQSLSVFRQLKRGLGRHLLWFMYSDGICLLDPDYANVEYLEVSNLLALCSYSSISFVVLGTLKPVVLNG